MYVSEAAWYQRQQKKSVFLRKAGKGVVILLLLTMLSLCTVGMCLRENCEQAEAADVFFSEQMEMQNTEGLGLTGRNLQETVWKRNETVENVATENNEIPLIIIDAGHGGEDEGCSGKEIEEKEINLSLALALQTQLEELGFRVLLTRTDDSQMSLEERVDFANESQGDLFLSIHQNASEYKEVEGIETWYCETGNTDSERFAKLVQQYTVLYTKANDRGVVESDTLYVIRECGMPSCLLETGFLSNNRERELLCEEEYCNKLVQGMVDAVWYFFNPKKMYLTFDDGPSEENTSAVLDALKEKGVKATFFVVGENVEKHPEILQRIVQEGHTVGIHCYNHSYDEVYKSVEGYVEDFEKARQLVYDVTGVDVWCYRFPGGSINQYNKEIYEEIIAIMTKKGYVYYDWNASLEDAVKKTTPEQLVENARESTLQRKKVVMLAHDIVYNTTLCMEELLEAFPEYEFLPLTNDVDPIQFK